MNTVKKATFFLLVTFFVLSTTARGASLQEQNRSVSVGEQTLGGVVFYTNRSGTHGLVAATNDQKQDISIYLEKANACSVAEFFDADGQEYTDWRLPTKHELNVLYQAFSNGFVGNFVAKNSVWYASSTEYVNGISGVWYQNFKSGLRSSVNRPYSIENVNVRCIRSF